MIPICREYISIIMEHAKMRISKRSVDDQANSKNNDLTERGL